MRILTIKSILLSLVLVFSVAHAYAQFASQQTYAGTAGGSATAITLSVPNISSISDVLGVPIRFIVASNSTGAATVTVGGLAAKNLTRADGTAIQKNDLIAGTIVTILYDGTQFQVTNPSLVQQNLPSSSTVVFSSSTSWTVPTGVTSVKDVKVWGAGGGGGGSSTTAGAGSGAGGGAFCENFNVAVTPGGSVTVTVGTGGGGGSNAPTNGAAGGGSSFGSSCTAGGGAAGNGGAGGLQVTTAGAGGVASVGPFLANGASGGFAWLSGGGATGGIGGAAAFGGSIPSLNVIASGHDGNFPGGGANGGAGGAGGSGAGVGGTGANGLIVLTY